MKRIDLIGYAVCGSLSVLTAALIIAAFIVFGDRP